MQDASAPGADEIKTGFAVVGHGGNNITFLMPLNAAKKMEVIVEGKLSKQITKYRIKYVFKVIIINGYPVMNDLYQ